MQHFEFVKTGFIVSFFYVSTLEELKSIYKADKHPTLPTAWILSGKNAQAGVSKILGVILSCLLNGTANPAQFGWKCAGLALLFSRWIPKNSRDFFPFFRILLERFHLLSENIYCTSRQLILQDTQESNNILGAELVN